MKDNPTQSQKTLLAVRVNGKLRAQIEARAKQENRSLSQISAMLLEKALNAETRTDAA